MGRHSAGRAWLVCVFAAVGSLALAAPAAAVKSEQEKFKIEVLAKQDIDWTMDFTSEPDACTGSTSRTTGSGGQSFSLTTQKPVKVNAVRNRIQGSTFIAIYAGKPDKPKSGVPVNIAAIQEGTTDTVVVTEGNGEACGDGGGGGGSEPPPSDCGPRSLKGEVRTAFYEPEFYPGDPAPLGSVLGLSGPFDVEGTESPLRDQWTNCPGPANDSGTLMETPTGGLKANKLFGKKKKFSVKAKDSDVFTSDSTQQTTEVNWKVDFTRLGR